MAAKKANTQLTVLPSAPRPEHSPIGASSMHRWAECPGSIRLSVGVPNIESAYAAEGTKAHELAATWLKGTGKTPECDDEEMLEHVKTYVDHVYSHLTADAILFVEHGFDLSAIYPGAYGTNDAAVYIPSEKTLYVDDLKYGAGKFVKAQNNPQLKYYALGALLELQKEGREIDTIVMSIVQPRCMSRSEGAVRSHTIDAMDLLEFAGDLVVYAKRTAEPDAPLKAGDHCQFCPAIQVCPEIGKIKQTVAKSEFAAATAPVQGTVPQDTLVQALQAVPLLKALIERIDAYAYAEAREGRAPEGYKLVEKRATRKWRDEHTVAMELGKLGLTQDELFAPREVKSPAQLEKIERIKGNKEVLAPFIIKESSGLVLVPNDDKRPAWRADAKDEFKALEAPKATVLDTDIVVAVEVVVDPFS
jgi:hypothetical protein